MAGNVWSELREVLSGAELGDEKKQALTMQALSFAELLVWWSNALTGKIKVNEITIEGMSISPARRGDGFCISLRGKHKKTAVVGFHMCGAVAAGLAEARQRAIAGSISWRPDEPIGSPPAPKDDSVLAETLDPSAFL